MMRKVNKERVKSEEVIDENSASPNNTKNTSSVNNLHKSR